MKYIFIATIFSISSLFANYAYTGQGSGKIDMHGGKSDKLTGSKGFSNSSFSLGSTFDKKEEVKKKDEKNFIPLENIEKIDSTK